jgi:dephospho-CoA kinase
MTKHSNNFKNIISLVGMSGVGKTTFAHSFNSNEYFHYSVDYVIGLLIKNDIIKSLDIPQGFKIDLDFKVSNLSVISSFL